MSRHPFQEWIELFLPSCCQQLGLRQPDHNYLPQCCLSEEQEQEQLSAVQVNIKEKIYVNVISNF
jgi:hypothetical protein